MPETLATPKPWGLVPRLPPGCRGVAAAARARGWGGFALLGGLAVLAFAPAVATAAEKVTLASGSLATAYATYYATEEMGFFAEAGLAPEMILAGSGAKAMATVVGGSVDVVMASAAEVVKARQKGIDLVLFSPAATRLGTNIVFSKAWAAAHRITKESPLEAKIAALKGARLAISSPGSLTDALVRYFARRGGLDPNRDMTLVGIANQSNAMLIALERDRIDGFVLAPPDTNIAAHTLGAVIAFDLAAGEVPELDGYFYIGFAAPKAFVASGRARKLVQALQRGVAAIADPRTTETVRDRVHAAKFRTVPREIFAEIWTNIVAGTPRDLRMNDAMFGKVALLEKVISSDFDPRSIGAAYTNDAIREPAP